jgi:hypothetical protein
MFHPQAGRSVALAALVCVILAMGVGVPAAQAVDTQMTIDTTSINFGNVNVGTTSSPMSVTLTNSGSDSFGPINIFGGAPPTPEFNASQNCQGVTLPAGGSCNVNYSFSPSAPGTFNDLSAFTISETASQSDGEDFSVSLTGVGGSAPTESVARVIPAAGSTPGNFGSFFRTGVQLSNPYTEPVTGRFVYHRAGVSGSAADPSLTFTVAPGATVAYDDLVETMGQAGLGSLDVVVPTDSNVPVIVARVYNDAGAAGTSGFTEEAIDPSGSDTRILFAGSTSLLVAPPNNTSLRFNIGVRTLTDGAFVTFRVHDASGAVINTVTKEYDPTFYEQQSASTLLGTPLPPNASIEVSVSTGSAIIYGATIDNVTNDPSIQFARVIFAVL